VGSEFRGDDAVALRVAELIESESDRPPQLHVFIGATAPENCTGPSARESSHLLVLDAADMQVNREPRRYSTRLTCPKLRSAHSSTTERYHRLHIGFMSAM